MIGFSPRSLSRVALFTALTALGAFLRVPVPFVPFTLQFFFCVLAGLLLGPREGAASQALYIALGLAGAPVFTSGGGPAYVLQPTFGYLLGFLACALVAGVIARRMPSPRGLFIASGGGLGAVYLLGVPWLYASYNFWLGEPRSALWALTYGFFLAAPGDLALAALAAFVARRLRNAAPELFPEVKP